MRGAGALIVAAVLLAGCAVPPPADPVAVQVVRDGTDSPRTLPSTTPAAPDAGFARPVAEEPPISELPLDLRGANAKSSPLDLGTSATPSPGSAQPFSSYTGGEQSSSPRRGTPAPRSSVDAVATENLTPQRAEVRDAIRRHFPQTEWGRAEAVAGCESGYRSVISAPNRNGSRDHGVFQLNDNGTLQELLRADGRADSAVGLALDVDWNVAAAARLHAGRGAAGWSRWSCAAKLGIVAGLWSNRPGPKADAYG